MRVNIPKNNESLARFVINLQVQEVDEVVCKFVCTSIAKLQAQSQSSQFCWQRKRLVEVEISKNED